MRISIIIPVYNTEKYLSQCLDSVVNQTYKELEIIIVNDGSTDRSLHIAQSYATKDARIIVISQDNQGQSVARNEGLKIASSEYVFFIDSDDYIGLNACEYLNHEIEQRGYDLIIFGRYSFYDDNNKLVYDKVIIDDDDYISGQDYLLKHIGKNTFTASPCNKLFKKQLLDKYLIRFESGIIYEDLLYVFESLFYANNIKLIEKPFYFYRQTRPESTVNTIKEKDKDVLITIDLLERFLQQNNSDILDFIGYKLLIYRWICNAVVFKYPCKAPLSTKANRIVKHILYDKRFKKYVKYIAKEKNVELKWRLTARLMLISYPIYVTTIYIISMIRKKIIRH